ncbi:unnamed protein product, partial [Meganyctiphanes norvegica]
MDDVLTSATLALLPMVVVAAALHTISFRRKTSSGYSPPVDVAVVETPALKTLPGPSTIPILGSMHHLRDHDNIHTTIHDTFTDLSEQFGPVYSLKLGTIPAVVVSSFEGIKEVLIKKANQFDGRPDITRFKIYFGGDINRC